MHKKVNSDQPVDEMEDEERELLSIKDVKKERQTRDCRNTGANSIKNSGRVQAQDHRESFKQRCFSNTEKDYACLINQQIIPIEDSKMMHVSGHEKSFSFEKLSYDNSKKSAKNPKNPKNSNLLEENKNLENNNEENNFRDTNLKQTKINIDNKHQKERERVMKTFCQENSKEIEDCVITHFKALSPSPNISMKSFNNMTNYVKNTFRKQNPTARKQSLNSYSSKRKYELIEKSAKNSLNKSITSQNKSKKLILIIINR